MPFNLFSQTHKRCLILFFTRLRRVRPGKQFFRLRKNEKKVRGRETRVCCDSNSDEIGRARATAQQLIKPLIHALSPPFFSRGRETRVCCDSKSDEIGRARATAQQLIKPLIHTLSPPGGEVLTAACSTVVLLTVSSLNGLILFYCPPSR